MGLNGNGMALLILAPEQMRSHSCLSLHNQHVDCSTSTLIEGKGRFVRARKKLARGDLLMSVPALAFVALDAKCNTAWDADLLQDLGLEDAVTLRLAIEASATSSCREILRGMVLHPESPREKARRRERAERVRALLRTDDADGGRGGGGGGGCDPPKSPSASVRLAEQDDMLELISRVAANLHRVLDDATASRSTGVGIFPCGLPSQPQLRQLAASRLRPRAAPTRARGCATSRSARR